MGHTTAYVGGWTPLGRAVFKHSDGDQQALRLSQPVGARLDRKVVAPRLGAARKLGGPPREEARRLDSAESATLAACKPNLEPMRRA